MGIFDFLRRALTGYGGRQPTPRTASKQLDAMELVASTGERLDFITFSMGIASYPASAESKDELIHAADEAMYRAKKAGGDRVCI